MNTDVELRRLKDTNIDYELLEKWYQQKEIYISFEQRRLNYDEIKSKYYPRTLRDTKIPVYMIEYQKDPVGIIQYKEVNDNDKKLYKLNSDDIYEIDIFIGNLKVQHKGIGSQAINFLSDYLFKNKKAKILVMSPLKTNINAINCYKKCGFIIKNYYDTEDTIGNTQTYALMIKETSCK